MPNKASVQKKIPLIRIAIGFLDCPQLNKDAATYLLLYQNTVQEIFEFSVFDLDAYPEQLMLDFIDLRVTISDEKYAERAKEIVSKLKKYVSKEWKKYTPSLDSQAQWLIITQARFEGEFYMGGIKELPVMSIANWKRAMAPPSLVEFILRQSHVALLALLNLDINHYETRGCLGDFNDILAGAKQHVLIGHVCSDCQQKIVNKYGDETLTALKKLTDRSWIGSDASPTSVAAIMKKTFDYDLYLTKGYAATRIEKMQDLLLSAGVQEFVKIASAIILAWALIKFGLSKT
jgi:hypothetical protein